MVYWYVEEALYLVSMQIHRDQACDASYREEVCDKLSTDRDTGLVLAVLSSPSEVGYDGCDVVSRGTLGRIDHE